MRGGKNASGRGNSMCNSDRHERHESSVHLEFRRGGEGYDVRDEAQEVGRGQDHGAQ